MARHITWGSQQASGVNAPACPGASYFRIAPKAKEPSVEDHKVVGFSLFQIGVERGRYGFFGVREPVGIPRRQSNPGRWTTLIVVINREMNRWITTGDEVRPNF